MSVRFTESARKHGFTEEEAVYAIENAVGHVQHFADPQPPANIRPHLFIGPRSLTDHTLLEVFLEVRGSVVTVFHVMEVQERSLNLIGRSYR
jgi:hypothetical protein